MKKQICFAGFSEAELADLQVSLAALRGTWDCVFSPDTASALDALAAAPFDAAVANLTSGGINDLELLHQAAIRHPRTLRFVLGDFADRELIENGMGMAHQFISRPWEPSKLISIIERGLALDSWLSNDKLRSFVPRLGKLPGLPATYFQVLKKAESPHSSVETISEIIARDPALTARLLQMVNSSACGLTEKITSPTEAVSMLGLETVKSLVLCLQLFAQSTQVKGASLSLDQLWHHSFSVAKLASKIVVHCKGSQRMVSDAYTAGLLHNIGQIVLATNLSREYSDVVEVARERKCSLQEMELEKLGVTNNQVGAYLLGLWGLPLPLVEATALYHAPSSATPIEFSVLTVVHIAHVLACEENGNANGLSLPKLDANYLSKLDLPKKTNAWRKLLTSSGTNQSEAEGQSAPRTSSSPRAKKEVTGSVSKLLVVAGVAAVIVCAVALRWNLVHIAHRVVSKFAPAVAAETSPAPEKAKAAETPAGGSGFDSIKIQGIIYAAGDPAVLINDTAFKVGERVNGVEIISIEPAGVILASKGQKKMFRPK